MKSKEEILKKHLESKKGLANNLNEELDLIRDAALNAMEEYANQPKEKDNGAEGLIYNLKVDILKTVNPTDEDRKKWADELFKISNQPKIFEDEKN